MARHDDITLRTPEQVTAASSKVSEADIRGWFIKVKEYLLSEGLSDALSDARRIYNGDETSFFLHPTTKAVLATPGNKNVYEVQHADGHTNVTVMFSFGADGSIVPPDVVLPVQRLRPEILQQFPGDWGVGKSPNEWMNVQNFMLYIKKIFYPFLLKKNVEFPVLYFIDGHSSHTAIEVADLCMDLGIILVALYPNTTRITQPADVAIFKPLKNAWNSAVRDWRMENGGDVLSLKFFPSVLQEAIESGIRQSSIVNGFRVCGLYPFDPENIDFSKCLATSDNQTNEVSSEAVNSDQMVTDTNNKSESNDTCNNTLQDYVLISIDTIKDALDGIGVERLRRIRIEHELTEDEKVIRSLYQKLLEPQLSLLNVGDETNYEPDILTVSDDVTFPDDALASSGQTPNEKNTNSKCEDSCTEAAVAGPVSPLPLADCTNGQHDGKRKADEIGKFLQTPPTPKRSKQHRNYARRFFPILTAEERLNEIRRLEQEKENAVMDKTEKAEKRKKEKENAELVKAKLSAEREAIKKQKAEIREQKRLEILQRKEQREFNRMQKQLKAEG